MLFTQVPRVCWLKPMVQKDVTLRLGSAYCSASLSRRSCGTPESLETFSRVYSETNLAKSSKLQSFAAPVSPLGLPSAPG